MRGTVLGWQIFICQYVVGCLAVPQGYRGTANKFSMSRQLSGVRLQLPRNFPMLCNNAGGCRDKWARRGLPVLEPSFAGCQCAITRSCQSSSI